MPNKPKLKEFFPVRAIEFALAYRTGAAAGRPDEIGAPPAKPPFATCSNRSCRHRLE